MRHMNSLKRRTRPFLHDLMPQAGIIRMASCKLESPAPKAGHGLTLRVAHDVADISAWA